MDKERNKGARFGCGTKWTNQLKEAGNGSKLEQHTQAQKHK
jgi:hypothetical protein